MTTIRKTNTRNLDAESGMKRTQNRPKTTFQESESEEEYVNPQLEEELEMPAKDETVRPKPKQTQPKPPRAGDHGTTGVEEDGQELATRKARETESRIAPHMMILLAATYHMGFSSITRPPPSVYIPSCRNLFTMAYHMMELVSENTYLKEMCPNFFSVSFYCYVGYLYFYQVLRAKEEAGTGQLTRAERRVLRTFKTIGEPESWPVPSPLIEFIRALGYYKSSNPQYSYVVPTFPDFTHVSNETGNQNRGYYSYHSVAGLQRVPPVTAYVEFLRLFGARIASYNADQGWIPQSQVNLDQAHAFLSITNSSATGAAFQALTFSDGWQMPTEGELRWGPIQSGTKRQIIKRWNIPNLSIIEINGIEPFLGLNDGMNSAWIRHLISMVNVMNRFFPGSTTLAAIDPICHIGTLTQVEVNCNPARVASDNEWYQTRHGWSFEYLGYDDTEQGRLLTRVGIATGTNYDYTVNVIPVGNLTTGRRGPFFQDDDTRGDVERAERFMNEGETESDPTGRFSEQLSTLFNPKGDK